MSTETYVRSHIEHGINTIEFFHPQSNSLPGRILEELAKEIHFAGTHDDTKVIILQSAGEKTFCSGASFDELVSIKNESEGLKFFSGFANVINAMRRCPKFIIGRIQGRCVGGGVGLASAVDYAIATDKSDVKLSELAVGIGPFVVGPAVERKIGTSAFNALAIDAGNWRNAEWARKKGLFAEVHDSIESLNEAVYRLADTLAHSNPSAMAEMKKIFWRGTEHWEELLKERAAISGRLVLSEFTRNAISKFKAKAK
ncbi:MAG TPA: enoyl-CoA hydratase/isomerase family protein [Ferruginibacter sp.]|nr:enoyl-CoA hydratase [Chitinophagaceae bacterium]HRI23373.1 enoyl-CoA hydratase/isomerase family protein [Ferruginibacter sp.]